MGRHFAAAPDGLTIATIARLTAEEAGIEPAVLTSGSRVGNIPRARHVAIYMARRRLRASVCVIGRALNCDHTTVCSADRRISELISAGDPFVCDLVARVAARLMERAAA